MDRIQLNEEVLESVNGGNISFNPQADGSYKMICQFSGQTFNGVSLADVMRIVQYGASIPNTAEGEQQIISWAQSQGII